MDALSAALALKALDGLSTRTAAAAQNIANANSPNYRPLRVTFEQALAAAARTGSPAAVAAVKAHVEADPTVEPGQGVRTDLDLATSATTASRYSALVEVLNRQLSLEHLAITGSE